MNQKYILIVLAVLVLAIAGFLGVKAFGESDDLVAKQDASSHQAPGDDISSSGGDIEITPSNGLTEKLDFEVGSKNYTLGPIPGHFWKLEDSSNLTAEHYNGSEPFAWASDVSADTLLYEVAGTLGSCRNGYLSDKPNENGFVHFHGSNEDSNVGFWLKHTAVTPFVWDGPPGNPDIGRQVPVGVDSKFPNICEFPAQQEEESNTSDNSLVEIEMTAKKFEFSPNVIRVKEGDTVKMTITSLDVTHGFAINELEVSQRIPAGETTTFEFVASKKGDFRFYCNVVCGIGHSGMVGDIFVE